MEHSATCIKFLLDRADNGAWAREGLVRVIEAPQTGAVPTGLFVVDSVRIPRQIKAIRQAYGPAVYHVHLYAGDDELRSRYQQKGQRTRGLFNYSEVQRNKTERTIIGPDDLADLVVATDRCLPAAVLVRAPRSRFASRARLLQLPPRDPFDFDLAFVPAGLREIVGHLQPQPSFRATAERLVEADRHLWRNTALAVNKVIEGLPRDPQNVRGLGNCQIERFDAVVPDREPRMGRVFHRHGLAPRFSGTRLNQCQCCSLG
jgi:hypothetical protein